MNRRHAVVVLLSAVASAAAWPVSAADADVAAARAVAGEWLSKVDGGNYSASWNSAAGAFRAAMSESAWSSAAQSVRQPLGAMRSRSEKSATATPSLPGAADGNHVVIQYDTAFDTRPNAVELVTVTQDKDGRWNVAGYFIQ